MSTLPRTAPKCVLPGGCVHPAPCDYKHIGSCKSLGQCGAGYALREATTPSGYRVCMRDNRTINALRDAGLIDLTATETPGVCVATARTIG